MVQATVQAGLEVEDGPRIHLLTVGQTQGTRPKHFLITLVHSQTGEQTLVDLLTDCDKLGEVRALLDQHGYQDWGLLKVLGLDVPF